MARAYTKCGDCGDIMWFGNNDPVPQSVVCPCGSTFLDEEGASGNAVNLTPEEIGLLNDS